nr:hypothetical protein [uncultured Allomuricauda sp.]
MKRTLSLLSFFILISCNDSEIDCSTVLCAAREDVIKLKFLDWDSHDNLLENGTINEELIEITAQGETIDFSIQESTYQGKRLMFPVSAEFGEKSFVVIFNDNSPLLIKLTTSLKPQDGCCGPFTATDNIEVINYTNGYTNYGALPLDIDVYVE